MTLRQLTTPGAFMSRITDKCRLSSGAKEKMLCFAGHISILNNLNPDQLKGTLLTRLAQLAVVQGLHGLAEVFADEVIDAYCTAGVEACHIVAASDAVDTLKQQRLTAFVATCAETRDHPGSHGRGTHPR